MLNLKHKEEGWTPYYYLVYTIFLFFQPIAQGGRTIWLVTLAGFATFLFCYFRVFWRSPHARWYAAAIAVLGYVSLPVNPGTAGYIIYAGTFAGFLFSTETARWVLAALIGAFVLEYWHLGFPLWYGAMMVIIMLAVSMASFHYSSQHRANARLKMAQDELAHLAKVAERERIARDLHDVLGHTLSVVVLKSELAARLLDRDLDRARAEMNQVEQIARQALTEVRQAISGYREVSMAEEMARARETLETAGVTADCSINSDPKRKLSPAHEALLTLVVREAVTNVVRHSGARRCRIALHDAPNGWKLQVDDDGKGGSLNEGNGLRGMRERVEGVGGSMSCDGTRGTRLDIFIPYQEAQRLMA